MLPSSNIRTVCIGLHSQRHNIGSDTTTPSHIGYLAADVARVAKMCRIPDNEVVHESTGNNSSTMEHDVKGREFGSCSKRIWLMEHDVSSPQAASCVDERLKQRWHITGHIHQQSISWQAHQQDDRHGPQQTTPAHHKLRPLQLQLQQEMLNKIGNNHLKSLQDSGGSGSLQSAGSNNSSMDRLLNYSNSSTPNAFVAESRNMFT